MTTHTRLRLGAVALVLLVVVLLSGAHLCGVAQDPGSRPLSTGALACTEFWLNRYQTLIGALVAVGAAVLAFAGVKMQIVSAERQVKVGRRQSSIALLEIMNERSSDVRSMTNEIVASYNRLSYADAAMQNAIKSIERMLTLVDNAASLRNEYVNNFERAMKHHSTLVNASEHNIAQGAALLGKALVSTETKSEIEEYIMLARHSHATHIMAQQVFSEIVDVFDESKSNKRAIIIDEKLSEAKSIVNIPLDKTHQGLKAAIGAAQNMSEIIDLALKDAEGRSEEI